MRHANDARLPKREAWPERRTRPVGPADRSIQEEMLADMASSMVWKTCLVCITAFAAGVFAFANWPAWWEPCVLALVAFVSGRWFDMFDYTVRIHKERDGEVCEAKKCR